MFVCKLKTPSCANYEHLHVYLAYRRQTGTVVTRQTYDRVPHLSNHPLHTFQGVTTDKRDNKSGWPSGLRRCVQVAVWFSRRGFESHFWQYSFDSHEVNEQNKKNMRFLMTIPDICRCNQLHSYILTFKHIQDHTIYLVTVFFPESEYLTLRYGIYFSISHSKCT